MLNIIVSLIILTTLGRILKNKLEKNNLIKF